MLELKPGWLARQIEATLEEMKTWPKWMLLEVELRRSHEENSRRVGEQQRNSTNAQEK